MKISIKKYRFIFFVVLASIVFFAGASYFQYTSHEYDTYASFDFVKWGSPDETANYIFAKLYGQEGRIGFEERYNLLTADVMRPRSFRSDWGTLKPVSFLGIILIYGSIVKISTYKLLPYLTPVIASLAIIFYYLYVKNFFGKKNAMYSSVLLAFFPVFAYYTARSMFHNVLFVSLLIFGFYFGLLSVKNKTKTYQWKNKNWLCLRPFALVYSALSGFFIGLAVLTRTSELIWLLPVLFLVWLFNMQKIGINKLMLFISFFILALVPGFYYNQILYGSPILGGYAEMNQTIINVKEASHDLLVNPIKTEASFYRENFEKITKSIFKFGVDYRSSYRMLKYYFVHMFPWLFWLGFLGLIVFLQKWQKLKKKHWVYLLSLMVLSFILIVYYGSWQFHDNPDPDSVTIGNSYTRYWLPIYLMVIPLAAQFIIRFSRVVVLLVNKGREKFNDKKFSLKDRSSRIMLLGLRILIFGAIIASSLYFVLFGSEEGLAFERQRHAGSRQQWQRVLELTESNSTIITRYHDKLFFPERKVIVGLFDDVNMVDQYANLAELLPVYYYNFKLSGKDLEYLNSRRLGEAGLGIEPVEDVTNDFSLYRLHQSATTTESFYILP